MLHNEPANSFYKHASLWKFLWIFLALRKEFLLIEMPIC